MKHRTHCDECGKSAPPLQECLHTGWYMSQKKSFSGIPAVLICPDCLRKRPKLTNNLY